MPLDPEILAIIPEKYHKAENPVKATVDALNASGGEVRKFQERANSADKFEAELKAMQEKHAVPDQYTLDFKEIGFQPGEPVVGALREAGLTQAQADAVLRAVGKDVIPAVTEARREVELKALSQDWALDTKAPEFTEKLVAVTNYAEKRFGKDLAAQLIGTAKGVREIERLRQADIKSEQTHGAPSSGAGSMSEVDIDKMVADPRYKTDAKYQAWVVAQIKQAFPG